MEHHSASRKRIWAARIVCGLVVLFMLFDSVTKLFKPAAAVEGTVELGYAEHHIVPLGIIGLIITILYAFPRTSVLGAILLTGYFGGAVATHFRLDNPLFSHTLFPVYIAILAWLGIWLREKRLSELLPLREKENQQI